MCNGDLRHDNGDLRHVAAEFLRHCSEFRRLFLRARFTAFQIRLNVKVNAAVDVLLRSEQGDQMSLRKISPKM
jgi:hypothetical protein